MLERISSLSLSLSLSLSRCEQLHTNATAARQRRLPRLRKADTTALCRCPLVQTGRSLASDGIRTGRTDSQLGDCSGVLA